LVEAALGRVDAAIVLRQRLVTAATEIRVGRFPRRLRRGLTLEQAGQVLRRALLLGRPALRLIDRARVDVRDHLHDAGVDRRLRVGGVVEGEAVAPGLALELLEAALGRIDTAVELVDDLVDTAGR